MFNDYFLSNKVSSYLNESNKRKHDQVEGSLDSQQLYRSEKRAHTQEVIT